MALDCCCVEGRPKMQWDSVAPFVPKVQTLLMHYADLRGRDNQRIRKGSVAVVVGAVVVVVGDWIEGDRPTD